MGLKEVALHYLTQNISVFPVNRDKTPCVAWKPFQERYATPDEVEYWWKSFPQANIGIVTGKISNLTVVDVERGGNMTRYPPTLTVQTGGGGWHFYYAYHPIQNKARIEPLTDIRSDGGYVVGPGSIHASGKMYTVVSDLSPRPFPAHLFNGHVNGTPPKSFLKLLEGVPKGSRNEAAARIAGKLLRALRNEPDAAWQALVGWNRINVPPLSEQELRATFESIARRELAKPTEDCMALDEKARLKLEKVFMAFGSQMHALERNAGGDEWHKYRDDAWAWSIAKVSALVDALWTDGQAGTQPPPAQKPESESATITVKGVTLQSQGNTKQGRPWKLYKVTDTHDTNYFTFHTSFEIGETYDIKFVWNEKDEKRWRSIPETPVRLRQTGEEPPPDDDISF